VRGRQWEAALLGKLRDLPPPAFILGAASSQALGFVRSLGRRGVPAVALSTTPGPWLWSRYCAARDTVDTEAALLARLLALGGRLPRKGVVVGTGEAEVLFLSRHREVLARHYHLLVPPAGVVERLADKRSQYQYTAGLGIRIPRTFTGGPSAWAGGDGRVPC
jgi:predicted ATP-grasp superfamily ATP-dependent carboligase